MNEFPFFAKNVWEMIQLAYIRLYKCECLFVFLPEILVVYEP